MDPPNDLLVPAPDTRQRPRRSTPSPGEPQWLSLLALVSQGTVTLSITSPAGGRAVVVAEAELTELRRLAGEREQGRGRDSLTPREREILTLIAGGMAIGPVATSLRLAVNTVAQHLVSARHKLGVTTTRAAVEAAGLATT